MKLSQQQQAVLSWADTGSGSLNLIARAGCGKTFTLLELVKHIAKVEPHAEIFLGAYNKKIADELKAKLTQAGVGWKQCSAGTLHSAGFSAWRKVAPAVKVDGDKMKRIIDAAAQALGPHDSVKLQSYSSFILRLVSLAKQHAAGFLFNIDNLDKWWEFVDHHGLEEQLEGWMTVEEGISQAIRFLRESIAADKSIIDFDDMIFAPLYHNARVWPKDWVLIDEAQDTNPSRRALAIKMLRPRTGRLVAVGDPAQAIYGFTGADADAMDIIRGELGSTELPLNQTYRCPRAVVELANTWVPDMIALPEAPEGEVIEMPLASEDADAVSFWQIAERKELRPADDVILCRVVRELIATAFGLIKRGIGCKVEGREIGAGLKKLITRFKSTTLADLADEISAWQESEVQKWQAKGKESRAAQAEDQAQSLLVICDKLLADGKNDRGALITFIDGLFGDSNGSKPDLVTLSTVHKAKGREWLRVFLIGRNKYMPSKWARKGWQQEQERNLCYVAVTRAKETLVDVSI
jgi:superfamily I DNA/RNA helicase